MDPNGEHHVARIDDTVTTRNLHERAEAVAVPDFHYIEQCVAAIATGLSRRRRHAAPAGRLPEEAAERGDR
jgi:hypothetical protein